MRSFCIGTHILLSSFIIFIDLHYYYNTILLFLVYINQRHQRSRLVSSIIVDASVLEMLLSNILSCSFLKNISYIMHFNKVTIIIIIYYFTSSEG